jgi:hypothetical protein
VQLVTLLNNQRLGRISLGNLSSRTRVPVCLANKERTPLGNRKQAILDNKIQEPISLVSSSQLMQAQILSVSSQPIQQLVSLVVSNSQVTLVPVYLVSSHLLAVPVPLSLASNSQQIRIRLLVSLVSNSQLVVIPIPGFLASHSQRFLDQVYSVANSRPATQELVFSVLRLKHCRPLLVFLVQAVQQARPIHYLESRRLVRSGCSMCHP